jgi:hypothetical protein
MSNKITRKKRCVSGCKSLDRTICIKSPRCSFTDGQTRKFCRLAKGFKMRKTDCKVTKRIKKAEAKKKIGMFILERKRMGLIESKINKSKINLQNEEKIKKNATRKIIKFFKKTGEKRTTEYLKAICSDSGVCIAFGSNRKKITNFFDGFTNFHYVEPPIKSIGNPSSNGFVKEIKYKKNDYVAYGVLKSSIDANSDNLVYEYIVGQFINQQCNYYPCFLETYGLYFYKDQQNWKHVKNTESIATNILADSLDLQDSIDYAKMCDQSKYAAILIQHLKDVTSLENILHKTHPKAQTTICYDLLYILYQVYMPLSQLKNNFTHYDLHSGNVLLYEPIKGKHIKYHYHMGDGKTITFNSPYIVKIIDYGRSFYKYNQPEIQSHPHLVNPPDIYKKLCEETKCTNSDGYTCGSAQGFSWMEGPLSKDNYFICSTEPNMSHDLRLLYDINSYIKANNISKLKSIQEKAMYKTITKNVLDIVKYGEGIKGDKKRYGTKVEKTPGFPNSINNVQDAERILQEIIMNDPLAPFLNEQKYPPQNKIGDIHVFNNGSPMRYESTF